MKDKGKRQGDMSPMVEDYQAPQSLYPENQPGKTTEYISRTDKNVGKESSKVKGQHYQGRYS